MTASARADPEPARRTLIFRWSVSSFFGWGIYGLNLALAMAEHPDYTLLSAVPFNQQDVRLDPLRDIHLAALARRSRSLWEMLEKVDNPVIGLKAPLLISLGAAVLFAADDDAKRVIGRPTIGVAFLERATLTPVARQRLDRLALVVTGCAWNENLLRAQGYPAAVTVLQGVDTSLFHPAPRAGLFPGRFIIFSGGKLEYRKGQDLVLSAFRAFRQRHTEALLMTAWHSPWNELASTASGVADVSQPPLGESGRPDVLAWAVANGIPAESVIALGAAPNNAMPQVIREADVAVFPNRCEGGTNLVAMECMACGIPTILSANTGHLDLLGRDGVALPLNRQRAANRPGLDTTDWGESDVEEIVERLGQVWRDRAAAAAMGQRAATSMAGMTWRTQIDLLLRAIEPVLE